MIQAVRITQYKTKDGAVFSSRDEAHKHEVRCTIIELLRKTLDRNQASTEELELVAAQMTSQWSPVIVLLKSPGKDTPR